MTASSILIVDDEHTIRNFLVRVLEHEGYQVKAAENGRDALRYLTTYPFDLLLTDIKMDLLDGIELLKEARQHDPDLAVILLTGHATVDSAITALQQGAYNYLRKPVKNEDIVAAVAQGLQARSRQKRRDELERLAGQVMQVMQPHLEQMVPTTADSLPTRIRFNSLVLDSFLYTATLAGQPLALTPTEFRLLFQLASSPGNPYDYVYLVQIACGYSCTRQEAQEIIGTHIRNLRSKLVVHSEHCLSIESVRGIGYRLGLLKSDDPG